MNKPLTTKQKLFCDYKMQGCNNHDAGVKAGYLNTQKGRGGLVAMSSPAVHHELAMRTNEELLTIGPMVIETLKKLLNSKNETVRLAAARDLADRIGLGAEKNSQQELRVSINLGNDETVSIGKHEQLLPPFPRKMVTINR